MRDVPAWIKMEDFRGADGQVDWSALNKARIENGEQCYRCSRGFMIFAKGHRELCQTCKRFDSNDGEVDHHEYIRCPKCKARQTIDYDSHGSEVYQEGDHEVMCNQCDYRFTIETTVSYSFESPALLDPSEGE